jgi:amino acid permease
MYLFSISLSTVLFAGAAVMGYIMFGESTESQFTLNLPPNLVSSKIAVWTTVIVLNKIRKDKNGAFLDRLQLCCVKLWLFF